VQRRGAVEEKKEEYAVLCSRLAKGFRGAVGGAAALFLAARFSFLCCCVLCALPTPRGGVQEKIQDVKHSADGSLVAVATQSTVFLYSGGQVRRRLAARRAELRGG
jgi:hypothetical protein